VTNTTTYDTPTAQIHQEVLTGEGLYLAQAAKLLPRYRRDKAVNPSTLFRWATVGVKLMSGERVRLEVVRIAGKLVTSKSALARFLAAQSPSDEQRVQMVTTVRTPTRRERDTSRASEELARRFGI
jgi:hypothetical protein